MDAGARGALAVHVVERVGDLALLHRERAESRGDPFGRARRVRDILNCRDRLAAALVDGANED